MSIEQQNFAVMFADVAGSTRIYERLGDEIANQLIDDALETASGLIKQHHGIIVKTIGDEVMSRFNNADQAIQAACELQETIDKLPARHGVFLMFRIGLHAGPALLREDGDIFGDAVNLAARMASIAKARQIITTSETQQQLNSKTLVENCREIDRMSVKGKEKPVGIVEVIWEPNDTTRMATSLFNTDNLLNNKPLNLFYKNNKHTILPGAAVYTIGRDEQCDQQINSRLVSRVHATIENRRGKFILIDESTNGTYLKVENTTPVFLRREEVVLRGQGIISFGKVTDEDGDNIIRYSL